MLNATSTLLKPIEKSTSSAKAELIMTKAATNHGAQTLFAKRL